MGELRYKPYGETRCTWGTTPTDRRFTGQREEASLGSLYDFGARAYSPVLGRFLSADTLVPSPGNPQSLNRYSYVLGNPLRYVDPTGHMQACAAGDIGGGCGSAGTGTPPPTSVAVPVPTPSQVATPAPPSSQAGPNATDIWRSAQRLIPNIELGNWGQEPFSFPGGLFVGYDVNILLSSCSNLNGSPVGKVGPVMVGTPRYEVSVGNQNSNYFTTQVYLEPLALKFETRGRI